MSSGNNKSKLSKHAHVIVGSGRFSGRTLGIKTGPGAPPGKNKRPRWYSGGPFKFVGGMVGEKPMRYGANFKRKNPEGRPARLARGEVVPNFAF